LPVKLDGETRIVEEHARFDVSILASKREVGARNERSTRIDRDAFGVKAAKLGTFAGAERTPIPRAIRRSSAG
jgi:hypothetical protein